MPKINYVIYTKVAFADDEWVRFEESTERMHFGPDHPFKVGESVKITFERLDNAIPLEPPV